MFRKLLASLCILVCSTAVYGQQTSPQKTDADSVKKHVVGSEVVVTGFPSIEGKTPAPLEHVDRETIQSLRTDQDVPKIAAFTPSAYYYSISGTDIGYTHLNLRGFDQTRISVMVNGIPQNDPEDHEVYWIDMPELSANTSDVDLQRGAGTAFYGPPAIGGSVNVETKLSPLRSILMTAGYGDFNTHQYAFAANSGLIDDKYVVYARLSQLQTDGYRDASWVKMTSYFVSAVRYDDNFTLQVNFYGGPFSDGLNYYGISKNALNYPDSLRYNPSEPPGPYEQQSERRPDEGEGFSQSHYELLSTWRINNSLTLSNSIFYVEGNGYFDISGDWAYGTDFFRLSEPYADRYGFTAISPSDTNFRHQLYQGFVGDQQEGWLPKLDILHENGIFTIAGEFRSHRSDHWGHLLYATELPSDLPGDYHFYEFNGGKDIANISLSEQYSPREDVHVNASLQMVNQRYSIFNEKPIFFDSITAAAHNIDTGWRSNNFTVPFTFFNPHLGVAVNLNPLTTSYASVSYTTREPRLVDYYNGEFLTDPNFALNGHGGYDFSQPLIKPEKLLDVEVGTSLVNQPLSKDLLLTARINGYYMAFHDELVTTGLLDGFGNAVERNASQSLHEGIELQGKLAWRTWFSFEANLTISKNKILGVDTAQGLLQSYVGNVPVGFTPILANVLLTMHPIDQASLSLMGRYVGTMYGDMANDPASTNDPYFVMDASASYGFTNVLGLDKIEAKIVVNNVFNKLYASYVTGYQFFVAAPRHYFATISIGL
jgi:iron complex outermembrane receptor protein